MRESIAASSAPLRVGSVSFLNAKPLIFGLENRPNLRLSLEVPSRLLGGLLEHRYDVALLPVIDYQRMDGLRVLSSGGIGCDGPTLTVRIFSRQPVEKIRVLACDTDSHTSVALAQIVLAERYGIRPTIVDLDASGPALPARHPETAKLLIGDKVVTQEPADMPFQIDLGQAWKELTGLPFLFAAWMARAGVELGTLVDDLKQARQSGLEQVEQIIATHAAPHGWPVDNARKYLTHYLQFGLTPSHFEAMGRFHHLAFKHGLLQRPPREIIVVGAV